MITYIVVTENHCWGKGTELKEALHNAQLRPDSVEDWFCDYIEENPNESVKASVCRTWASWLDYGKEERKEYDKESVKFVLYRHDSDLWEDFEISDMDGSVTFYPRKELGHSKADLKKLYDDAHTKCVWKNGMIGEGRW